MCPSSWSSTLTRVETDTRKRERKCVMGGGGGTEGIISICQD